MTSAPHGLPRGFRDRAGRALQVEAVVTEATRRRGIEIGCDVLHTSPVGFAERIRRGGHTTGDKTYTFRDRAGRELMLTPDSTPAVMRWFVDETGGAPRRICFLSQVFRYRRTRFRHFHQLGFALMNEPEFPRDPHDHGALVVARAGLRLFRNDLRVPFALHVQDFAVWTWLLAQAGLAHDDAQAFMHAMRPLDGPQRLDWLARSPLGREARDLACELLACSGEPLAAWPPRAARAMERARHFAADAVEGFDVPVAITPGDFHASELHDGIAFQFAGPAGERRADGGAYDAYARRFDSRLTGLKSFALGIEHFIESDDIVLDGAGPPKLLVAEHDGPSAAARDLCERCCAGGVPAVHAGFTGNRKRLFAGARGVFRWVIVLGAGRSGAEPVVVHDLVAGSRWEGPLDGVLPHVRGAIGPESS